MTDTEAVRLCALLEGLECANIDELMRQPPEVLRAVGAEIATAAKLGAHLYHSKRKAQAAKAEK